MATTRAKRASSAPVENDAYIAFARRVIRSAGKRLGEHPDALGDLLGLQAELDAAVKAAVTVAREEYALSWADIGSLLGVSRQAAQQRFGS
jgi:hypothetical protein